MPCKLDVADLPLWAATRVEFRDVGGVHTGVICAAIRRPAGSIAGVRR
jgi:hypothetical protein